MSAVLVAACAAYGFASGVVAGLLIAGRRVRLLWVVALVAAALALCPALALADPCPDAVAVEPGDTIECAGVLWPEPWTRAALQCAEVDLPHCQERSGIEARAAAADLTLCTAERDAARIALRTVEAVAVPPPAAWYERPAVVWPVAVGLGFVAGAALAVAAD